MLNNPPPTDSDPLVRPSKSCHSTPILRFLHWLENNWTHWIQAPVSYKQSPHYTPNLHVYTWPYLCSTSSQHLFCISFLADLLLSTHFGRNPRSSDSLRGSRNFVLCQLNNAWFHRFPVGQISQNLNTTTSIAEAVKTFGTEFWKFYQKNAKLFTKFPGPATSGRHSYIMITDRRNSLSNDPPMGCLVSIFTVRINSKSFPWAVRAKQGTYFPYFGNVRCPILDKSRTPLQLPGCRHGKKADWKAELETENK